MAGLPKMRIENATILYKNFSGEERKDPVKGTIVNRAGCRNFCVQIDEEDALRLKDDGWNIKQTKPNEEYDQTLYYLPVECRFDNYPPIINMYADGKVTTLDESTVSMLDNRENVIEIADIIINPSAWALNGLSGIKAYLSKGDFKIKKDDWQERHANWLVDDQEE